MLAAQRGAPPHLTPDMLEHAPELRAFVLAAGDVLPLARGAQSYAKHLTAHPEAGKSPRHPLHAMMTLPQARVLALAMRTPNSLGLDDESNPVSNANLAGATAVSDRGHARVTPAALADLSLDLGVDVLSLAVEEVAATASASRTEKAFRRTVEWSAAALKHLAAAAAARSVDGESLAPAVLVPVEGGPHVERRMRYVETLVSQGVFTVSAEDAPALAAASAAAAAAAAATAAAQGVVVPPGAPLPAPAAPAPGAALVTGAALGGLATAQSSAQRAAMAAASLSALPASLLRATAVLGAPREAVELVAAGLDLVTVSYPTALADAGLAVELPASLEELQTAAAALDSEANASADEAKTEDAGVAVVGLDEAGLVTDVPRAFFNMRRPEHAEAAAPLQRGCACYACRTHSRGYIHHLLNANEMLAEVLLMLHNAHAYERLWHHARAALAQGPEAWAQWSALATRVLPAHDMQEVLTLVAKRKVKPRDMRDADE